MKKRFYIKTAFLSLTAMAFLSSCLKDSRYINFGATKPLVELPGAANVSNTAGLFEVFAFSIASTPTPLNVAVNVAQANPLTSPITVKLALDTAALNAYNAANSATTGVTYTLLPTTDYSTTFTVTVPVGTNLANMVVNINTSLIDPSQNYVLPLKIVDGGGDQISNYNTVLYNVQVKNAFDGEYTVTGTMTDVVVPTDVGAYPIDADLVTAGSNSAYMFSVAFQGPAHDIVSAAGPGYYGDLSPQFTFSATNVTSVINVYGQPAPDGRSLMLDPTGTNTLTGTPGKSGFSFKVKYIMVQNGVNRTTFDETWTYKGPR